MAAEIPADRSPSPISRMRAPASRTSAISWLVALAVENHDGEIARPRARRRRRCCRRFSATGASRCSWRVARRRSDDDLVHVDVGSVQEPATLGGGQHGDRRPDRTGGAEVGALERIDGDVDCRVRPPDPSTRRRLLADVEHRRLVALALSDHDATVAMGRSPGRALPASPPRRRGRSACRRRNPWSWRRLDRPPPR